MQLIRNLILSLRSRHRVGPKIPRGLEVTTLPMIEPYPGDSGSES